MCLFHTVLKTKTGKVVTCDYHDVKKHWAQPIASLRRFCQVAGSSLLTTCLGTTIRRRRFIRPHVCTGIWQRWFHRLIKNRMASLWKSSMKSTGLHSKQSNGVIPIIESVVLVFVVVWSLTMTYLACHVRTWVQLALGAEKKDLPLLSSFATQSYT